MARKGSSEGRSPATTAARVRPVSGDLGWGEPEAFTRGLLDEALRSTEDLAAQVVGSDARSRLPVIDAAPAPGRLTGPTGQDEVIWLRACLAAFTAFAAPTGGNRLS